MHVTGEQVWPSRTRMSVEAVSNFRFAVTDVS